METILSVIIVIGAVFLIILALELRNQRQENDRYRHAAARPASLSKSDIVVAIENINAEHRNANIEQNGIERSTININIITLLFIAIYTTLNYFQLRTTREAFTTVQRAFVTVSGLQIDPNYDQALEHKINFWSFTPVIKNSGTTPTRELNFMLGFSDSFRRPGSKFIDVYNGVELSETPLDPELYLNIKARPSNHGLIGPNSTLADYIKGAKIGSDVLEDTIKTGHQAFVYGAFRYHDAFANTTIHITKFCYAIAAFNGIDGIKPVYGLCAHWNCADDECVEDQKNWAMETRTAFSKAGKPIPWDTPIGWALSGKWPQ